MTKAANHYTPYNKTPCKANFKTSLFPETRIATNGDCAIRLQKKPVVVNDKIEIRKMPDITVLLDHDVVDGAEMSRFIGNLSANIVKGIHYF